MDCFIRLQNEPRFHSQPLDLLILTSTLLNPESLVRDLVRRPGHYADATYLSRTGAKGQRVVIGRIRSSRFVCQNPPMPMGDSSICPLAQTISEDLLSVN